MDVGFAGAEVAALDGVVEEAVDAVAVVLVVLGGIDAALGGDAVGAARAVLVAEAFDVVALFREGSGGGGSGEAAAYDDDGVFPAVGGIDQFRRILMAGPFRGERAGGGSVRWGVTAASRGGGAGFGVGVGEHNRRFLREGAGGMQGNYVPLWWWETFSRAGAGAKNSRNFRGQMCGKRLG